MLILLAAFNNLLAGVFMALMDAYGLELVSVEAWGLLWGVHQPGLHRRWPVVVARNGLGPRPLRIVLAGNLVNWAVCSLFAVRSSIVFVTVGMIVWLALIPVIEAAEQTILQRAIPFERQGRVFGFAQLIENAAAPLTAFLIAPLAETVFMPLMTDGWGADLIGDWFGTGPDRGLGSDVHPRRAGRRRRDRPRLDVALVPAPLGGLMTGVGARGCLGHLWASPARTRAGGLPRRVRRRGRPLRPTRRRRRRAHRRRGRGAGGRRVKRSMAWPLSTRPSGVSTRSS